MNRALWHEVGRELAPFDGRLGTAWRISVICSLATLAFMTWQIPLAAIGCYLVLFVMKPDPGESTLMAIGICILVSTVVALLVWLTQLSIDIPALRLFVLASASFIFMYLASASKLGPAGNIIALVIAFIMTLLGSAPFGEVATRGILYAWLMTLIPMGLLIACNMAFGRSAPSLLTAELARRIRLAEDILAGTQPPASARQALHEGGAPVASYLQFISIFHLLPTTEIHRLRTRHEHMLQLLMLATRLPDPTDDATALSDTTQAAAVRREIQTGLNQLDAPVPQGPPEPHSGFFRADALSNPEHYRFALKTTLAASLAYITYTALDWQDIHTAMVTCYVAALGSTGETLHKLTLRIVGCLIGAAMGIASILFLIPYMTSIGELMLLVFAGILVAGWVSSGSERIAYAGVQIGLAFLLTVLQGFGPDVEISVATDRVAGILLGNALLYLIFTRIWPISSLEMARAGLAEVREKLQVYGKNAQKLQTLAPSQAANLLGALGGVREQLVMRRFEPRTLHTDPHEATQLQQTLNDYELRCISAALDPQWATPPATEAPLHTSLATPILSRPTS
ncbi:FUSC family protein [Pusillimonas sp. T2]|uniref:FUSC family protein n=1 Tax=Pusillimonas sp. T2 TaxID=1548123 RepID=UPI000B9C9146|nr:FUSC family protein [Pusillimonas sp. T2]OXR49915.1 FUSC family protein [Pusillimonas sp. T2]